MNIDSLTQQFYDRYGQKPTPTRLFFAPGRVNLIGEHTDYNGGYVFPCALSFGTYLMMRENHQQVLRLATTNFEFASEISLDDPIMKIHEEWVNYPLGVIKELQQKGLKLSGYDLLFSGNIPNNAGLSSSASIELVTAVAFNELFHMGIGRIELVKTGQAAENNFVGVNCGIMDQFAVGMGQKNHALFLNCNTLDYEAVPVRLVDYQLVIANTNKSRGLADSKYNERVIECNKAVQAISAEKPIQYLAELNNHELDEYAHLISDKTILKRARHVVSENQRVFEAVHALKSGRLTTFGQLMNASHDSLRDDYEVTGTELDTLVDESRKIEGVIGSRMTGAGFGGCTVSLVKDDAVQELMSRAGEAYRLKTGLKADFYLVNIGDGAKEITNL